MVILADLHTTGKWSGRRLIKSFKKKLKGRVKGKCIWIYRVTLMDGKIVSVDSVTVIKKIEKSS
jgi:hypothetical protein